jgi:hypothetical protein
MDTMKNNTTSEGQLRPDLRPLHTNIKEMLRQEDKGNTKTAKVYFHEAVASFRAIESAVTSYNMQQMRPFKSNGSFRIELPKNPTRNALREYGRFEL